MSSFPGPRHGNQADEAEQRRRNLRQRFKKVSSSMERGPRRFTASGSDKGGTKGGGLTPFEIAIGVGIGLFLVFVGLMALG